MDQHCTGKILVQFWPALIKITLQIIFLCKVVLGLWVNIAQVIFLCNVVQLTSDNIAQEKILFNVVLILLGHYTGKNLVQFCPRASRKHFHIKKSSLIMLLYSWDKTQKKKHNVVWITSLSNNFNFESVNFLIITSSCKCHTNIAQIFLTLQKKIPRPTFNKKTRLYRTIRMGSFIHISKN